MSDLCTRRCRLSRAFSNAAVKTWALDSLAPGTNVPSDGLACFSAVIDAFNYRFKHRFDLAQRVTDATVDAASFNPRPNA